MAGTSVFVFRRDLRLFDNVSLNRALSESSGVIPCFVFDKRQAGAQNQYKSANALQFMCESLSDLSSRLSKHGGKLHILHGVAEEVLPAFAKQCGASSICCNRDYTPFSILRDEATGDACKNFGIAFHLFDDALLHSHESVRKTDGFPYTVFTPYFRAASKIEVEKPSSLSKGKFISTEIPKQMRAEISSFMPSPQNKQIFTHGGRGEAEKLLRHIPQLKNYSTTRNLPATDGTTSLSAHLKFGTISPREAYWAVRNSHGPNHPLIAELYWRDFFTQIAAHFPRVFGGSFRRQYDKIKWENKSSHFRAWCEGKTGYPIVDAGMRQLNATGWMHGRVRMIVSSFLAKDLHIDWRWGEKYFAQALVDYDPCVNNGNWQWSASTGCDAQPYFRVFSPWRQMEKFDPKCEYVKKWVKELSHLSAKEIFSLENTRMPNLAYPKQIVEHKIEAAKSKEIYSAAASGKK